MVPHLPTPWTYPFTAGLAQAVPMWLTAAAILTLSLLLRSQLLPKSNQFCYGRCARCMDRAASHMTWRNTWAKRKAW